MTDLASVKELRNDMRIFEKATGAKINDDKTMMILLGRLREKQQNMTERRKKAVWNEVYEARRD